jgi:hypothetical protein
MKNKTQKLPPEVYYLVLNGAKQYFKNKEDAEEMARKLYEDGTSPGGIYTENDPDEIQDLYDAGYFHEGDDKLDHEVVNDKSLDAIKDNFTPPGAKEEGSPKERLNPEDLTMKEEHLEKMPPNMRSSWENHVKKIIGANNEDELSSYTKALEDYVSKNKKGRDDIPVTTRR